MPLSAGTSFLIILLVALTTFATRVTPFLVFPKGKEIPKTIQYLGKVLTPAIIGMLVVYCLKNIFGSVNFLNTVLILNISIPALTLTYIKNIGCLGILTELVSKKNTAEHDGGDKNDSQFPEDHIKQIL